MSAALDLAATPLALAYADAPGRQAGAEPVLFVHGFGHHRGVWQGVTTRLGDRWRRIALDLRGHGDSPWSTRCAYDLDDYASDLPPLLDALEVDSAHVVAHSMGGQIALLFAGAHPERVRSLTLVDTGPALRSDGSAHVLEEIDDAFRIYRSVDDYRRTLGQIHPFADGSLLDAMAEVGLARRLDGRFELALDPGVAGATQPSTARDPAEPGAAIAERTARLWSCFRGLDAPKLVTRGRLSSILAEDAARAMERVGGDDCRLVQFEGAGHAIMIDACADFTTELSEFLARIADEPPSPPA